MKPNIKTFSVGLTMLIIASLGSKRSSPVFYMNNIPTSNHEIKASRAAAGNKNDSKEAVHSFAHSNTKPEKNYQVSSSYSPVTRNTFVEGAGLPK